jgi:protein-tyrosine phosphatase
MPRCLRRLRNTPGALPSRGIARGSRATVAPLVRVAVIPPGASGLGAPLVLASAPGRRAALDDDLRELHDEHGVSLLVSLVGDSELEHLGILDLVDRARAHRITVRRFPIADHSTPDSMADTRRLVAEILAASRRGLTVGIHCWAGLGRTGLVATCCLVAAGSDAIRAVTTVRAHRPGAVEDSDQEDFIEEFAAKR